MKTHWIIITIIIILLFATGMWPIGLLALITLSLITPIKSLIKFIIKTIYEEKAKAEEPKQHNKMQEAEIEQKEIDIVRKSNDILLHLIQDKNREEDGH